MKVADLLTEASGWPRTTENRSNLAYWVMRALGYEKEEDVPDAVVGEEDGIAHRWDPCHDWAQGGPLLEKHQIIYRHVDGGLFDACVMHGKIGADRRRGISMRGQTLLVAALRALVADTYGEEVPEQ